MTARRIENGDASSVSIGQDAIGASLAKEAWSDMHNGRHCHGGGSAGSILEKLPELTICEEIGRGIRSALAGELAVRELEDRLGDHDEDWKERGKRKTDPGICHAWDLENLENKRR